MNIEQYIRFVAALAAVLALIFAVLWLLKRLGMAGAAVGAGKSRRRLAVVEALALDARRRLVLVRRDGVEHLLLLGGAGDLLIESGLSGGFAAQLAQTQEMQTQEISVKTAPEAALNQREGRVSPPKGDETP